MSKELCEHGVRDLETNLPYCRDCDPGANGSRSPESDAIVSVPLPERIRHLESEYGGIRAAARSIGVDAGYLIRLRDGKKTNPSTTTLAKLGLRKEVVYVLQ